MRKLWNYIFCLLILILVLVLVAIFQIPDSNLHIVACDVGQGDAILVTYGSIQILTDGGPDSSVLNCLGRHVPFWDRNIELVISTHPDADHSTGLTDVIKRYNVDSILVNPIDPSTDIYRLLEKVVGGKGVGVVNPKEGMGLRLDMIHLDILSPNEEMFSKLTLKNEGDNLAKYSIGAETNLYSIVYRLSFKKFSGLFPGDIPKEESDILAANMSVGPVNYIKIPHHGSANGLTQNLLEILVPGGLPRPSSQHEPYTNSIEKASAKAVGVISVGAKNPWGFPAPAILQMLTDNNVKVLRTDQIGDAEVITDGEKIWWKN